jgi:hypothetical protein
MTYDRSLLSSNSNSAHKITWNCTLWSKLSNYYYHSIGKTFFGVLKKKVFLSIFNLTQKSVF